MDVTLCSFPLDCLRIILSKVDYGDNRSAVWALAGSCRTLRQALKECPADVELQDGWGPGPLEGTVSQSSQSDDQEPKLPCDEKDTSSICHFAQIVTTAPG